GVVIIALVTAIGGGTTRDLLLDRYPIFWITDSVYLLVILFAALFTIGYTRYKKPPLKALLYADALGLAVFTITGAEATQNVVSSGIIIVIMAVITGTVGGLLRDVLTNEIPMIMQRDIYATAALAGAAVYLLLQPFALPSAALITLSMGIVIGLRMMAIQWGLHLPRFKLGS
ncbi:MAG: trimeric intracellular cation channel family protein, partial [Balneolales bacterium]